MIGISRRSLRTIALAGAVLGLFGGTQAHAQAADPSKEELANQVKQLREEMARLRAEQESMKQAQANTAGKVDDALVRKAVEDVLADAKQRGALGGPDKNKWYERLSFRGYTQFRYYPVANYEGADINVINERSVGEDSRTFEIRRGRFILQGDVTEHLFLYAQFDAMASVGGSGLDFSVQTRDLYADIALDRKKEFRIRAGESKVPFGWVNLQSSQNRAPMERPDALNSAVEGERDIGVYFMWAPEEIRKRFRELVSSGLKGSGDYGVFAIGAYSGQGLNRQDVNGEAHILARASYPFKLANGQFVELGVQGYTGRFRSNTSAINPGTGNITPVQHERGVLDERVGATFVWYPQPFGIEAEWNIGRGPQLSNDFRTINDEFLTGGYVQLNYKYDDPSTGTWFPFIRWQYFDGGRKFAANAPNLHVNEIDIGVEWSPYPEVELTLMYTRTIDRTNTRVFPYDQSVGDRFGIQLQWNY